MITPSLSLLGKKIAFSTLVQYAGKALQLVFSMLNLKLISNFFISHDYGIYAAIAEYTLFFSTVANLGIFGNLVRKMADAPDDGKLFFNAMLLRVTTAFFFFAVAIMVLVFSGAERVFIFGAVLYFGSLFFDQVKAVCDGAMQANYIMGRATFSLLLGKIAQFAGVYLLVKVYGEDGVILGNGLDLAIIFLPFLVGSLITVGASLFFLKDKIKWSFKADLGFIRTFFITALPFGIINIFNNLYFRFLPDYFANRSLTSEQFASFSVDFRIAQVLSLASTFLMFSVLPGFKQALDEGHLEKARHLYQKIKKILLAGGILLFAGGTVLSTVMVEFFTHKKYIIPELWFVLPLMLFLAAVSYGYDLVLIVLFALEKEIWFLKREVIALLIGLVFFGASMLFNAPQPVTLLILLGAIAGEAFMVVSGLGKIKNIEI